ncbi:MAG: oxygen-dependent coproporphyrinogen oxidase [bacterium]|nr:oxygen-dependent coproporphyrinogen oxidase [bacterium]
MNTESPDTPQPPHDPENLEQLFDQASGVYRDLQDRITHAIEALERDADCFNLDEDAGETATRTPAKFEEDLWQGDHSGKLQLGGGGRTRVLNEGRIFEKGGVNFSDVNGLFSEEFAKNMPGESREFRASGVSLVLHPRNPHAPTVHANFRVIRRGPPDKIERLWFGGGADLTPHYLYAEDGRHFHECFFKACEKHSEVADYAEMKTACDEYFYLPHREEARGIGGIFYDYRDQNLPETLAFSADAGAAFIDAYVPLIQKRAAQSYSQKQRDFQLWKRGRYVEFNLIYDRGTTFGLRTGGRIESILMSLPPLVAWHYNFQPEPGSPEDEVLKVLRQPVDWV